MENMQIPVQKNHENFKNLNLNHDIININDKECKFDFKIKVIQRDLTVNNNFYNYFHNLNNSSVPFMVQHSGYIKKLNFMNNFTGGTLTSQPENTSSDFVGRAFVYGTTNPEVLETVERKKDEMLQEALNKRGTTEIFIKDLLEHLAVSAEDWEFEDVDIPGNLYMFDMVNGTQHDDDTEEDDEEYDDFDDDYDEFDDEFEDEENDEDGPGKYNDNLEVKFNASGSIKMLENNILEVKYDESDMTGIKNAYVRFLFDLNKKDFVTIHKFGHSDTWINCEKGERVSGFGRLRGNGSNVTVDTKEIVNNMTPDGGQLFISYIREMNGTPSEMITHVITASPVRE